MNLNARERKIAIGVVIAAVFMLLYYLAYEPYSEARADVQSKQDDLTKKLHDADLTFRREKVLRPIWVDMQKGGLNVDPASAGQQTMAALNWWANEFRFNLATFKTERTTQEGTFDVVGLSGSGNGSMPQVAHMLASIEMAGIPIRISELSITPVKEGTDDLNVRFSLSALCQPPAGSTPPKTAGSNEGGQSS